MDAGAAQGGSSAPALTFGVIERVHVSADVSLQVVMEARGGGEEVQTDGHQLPASFQAVVAEILCSLTTQLDIKLVTQTLVTPPTNHYLSSTQRRVSPQEAQRRHTNVI